MALMNTPFLTCGMFAGKIGYHKGLEIIVKMREGVNYGNREATEAQPKSSGLFPSIIPMPPLWFPHSSTCGNDDHD